MNQNMQVVKIREEISAVTNDLKDLENERSETKLKLFWLEYNFSELDNKEEISTKDSIVIRNIPEPQNGDEHRVVTETLAQLNIEEFVSDDDIKKVIRKGNTNGKLGSIFVKPSDERKKKKKKKKFQVKIMKSKKELKNHGDE